MIKKIELIRFSRLFFSKYIFFIRSDLSLMGIWNLAFHRLLLWSTDNSKGLPLEKKRPEEILFPLAKEKREQ